MIAGALTNPELNSHLMLQKASSFNYLNQSGCYTLEDVDDSAMFDQLRLALQVFNSNGVEPSKIIYSLHGIQKGRESMKVQNKIRYGIINRIQNN